MSHTLDTKARLPVTDNSTVSTSPVTLSYTCGDGTTLLCLGIVVLGTTARAGGSPTYNGVAMQAASAKTNAGGTPETCVESWYMIAPPTGQSLTISIPNTGTRSMTLIVASSKAPAGKTSQYVASSPGGGSSQSPARTGPAGNTGDFEISYIGTGAQAWAPSARTGTQLYDWDSGAQGMGGQYLTSASTAGSSHGWTFTTATEDWAIAIDRFAEVVATISASASQNIPPFGQTATATVLLKAAAAQTVPAFTQAATSKVLVKATAAQSILAFTQTATGTVRDPVSQINGQVAQTIPAFGQSSTARITVKAAAVQTAPVFGQVAAGRVLVKAAAAQTVPAFQQASTSKVLVRAVSAQSVPAFSQTATSKTLVRALAAQSVPAFAQSATAGVPIAAQATQTLPAFSQAAGAVIPIAAAASQAMPAWTQSATLTLSTGRDAVAAQAIPPFSQTARAAVLISATAAHQIAPFAQVATVVLVQPGVPTFEQRQGITMLVKDTASAVTVFMRSSDDHLTAVTGANLTLSISKAGSPFVGVSRSVTEVGSGAYSVVLTAADTNTEGDLLLRATAPGADDALVIAQVVAPDAFAVTGPVSYNPTSAMRIVGSDEGGDYTNLLALDESNMVTGEVAGTGLEVTVTVSATEITETPSLVRIVGHYTGGAGHFIDISAYNYVLDEWEHVGTMLNRTDSFAYAVPMRIANQHPSTGAMTLRFLHSSPATYIPSHVLHLDYVIFEKVATNDAMASDVAAIRAKTDQLQFVLSGVIATLETTQRGWLEDLHEFLALKVGAPVITSATRQGSARVAVILSESDGVITATREV